MVDEAAHSALAAWDSFYVIVGSSAAALTGLQFVVMALVADARSRTTTPELVATFGTPNIVHFCAVLLLSAILSMPWHSLTGPDIALGACGVAGVGYGLLVLRRARRQTGYRPVLEDWLWHTVFPLLAYLTIAASAVMLGRDPATALFALAAAAILLLFIGIHNAWDTVTYIAADRGQRPPQENRYDR
jgi:hypothetical protein